MIVMKRILVFVHRWLGIVLCLAFLIWFPSGIGMMYWTFPAATAADRLQRLPALDASTIALTPAEAWAALDLDEEMPRQLRLTTFDGRPAYRFAGGPMVYADTGEEQVEVSRFMVNRAAAAWTGKPVTEAQVTRVDEVDQWTVAMNLRSLRPVWKFSWPSGEQVYVSEATGQVVQHTTTASRIGAWLGPIPHWFYFTPLRKNGPEWSRVVVWSSGIGTFAAILGLVVGAWMYSPNKRYRYDGAPSAVPYRGQKRWHMVLGLVFGVATATWAFSGMLSMDPFPASGGGGRGEGPDLAQALRGRADMSAWTSRNPREALARLEGLTVKELELTSFAGEPVYLAHLGPGETRIVPLSGGPRKDFDRQRIIDVVTTAAGSVPIETRVIEQYDRYYLDRNRERPLPVILAQLGDEAHTRYYIDPKTARIVGSYSSDDWVQRWAYNGLHSLNFPWLYNYRPLWDIVVIAFMLGGTALCITSLVLAWRVLGRKLRAIPGVPRGKPRLSDDLALADP
jgi:hypothetical protein